MNLKEVLRKRYTTKAYDKTRRIPDDIMSQLLDSLRLCPSSVNIQPWHYIIADDVAGKERVAKSTVAPFGDNAARILNASHVVVLCGKINLIPDHLAAITTQEKADGRYATDEAADRFGGIRETYVRQFEKDGLLPSWIREQVFIAQGFLLLSAALLGIDATPMGGVNMAILDEELGLKEQNLTPVVLVTLGYHDNSDYNFTLPKSRLSEDVVFSKI